MGTIKLLIGLLALIGAGIAGFQIAPPLFANYSFQDDLQNIALVDGASLTKTPEDVRTDVLHKAQEHGLQLDPKQITVQDISTPGVKAVYVAVDYSVPINLPFYSFEMHFTPNSGNKGL
ncbi:MAG TPA: hypothetical protein VMU61_16445 [Candidatus Aquilonibacter sp.]|nr:hypothetical protein [Candidatus Aquilonibacter sp.]